MRFVDLREIKDFGSGNALNHDNEKQREKN